MDILDIRTRNLRSIVESRGGVSRVARDLGYANPSFLSQMIGPTPSRVITEKTARKFEQQLGLPTGALDRTDDFDPSSLPATAPTPPSNSDTREELLSLMTKVIEAVSKSCEEAGVAPSPQKFGRLLTVGLEDAVEHNGNLREAKIRSLVDLLR